MKQEEIKEIILTLEEVKKNKITGYEEYFNQLTIVFEELLTQKKASEQKEIHIILAYLKEMNKNPSIFYEEPRIEVYEKQEVIWPTTISLWKEDIEAMLDAVI
ncbi:MAG: hypothetical protein ACERKN_03380 [Velocimicrobium sp.]